MSAVPENVSVSTFAGSTLQPRASNFDDLTALEFSGLEVIFLVQIYLSPVSNSFPKIQFYWSRTGLKTEAQST